LQINRKNEGLYCRKPSVVRNRIRLGANTKHDGYYEGNGYAVTYTFGHLYFKEPNDYKSYWKSWDLNNLPMLTNLKPKWWKIQVSKAVQNHKSLFDKAELVINCGDAEKERIDTALGHE
jgi:DNA topoisomerase-3